MKVSHVAYHPQRYFPLFPLSMTPSSLPASPTPSLFHTLLFLASSGWYIVTILLFHLNFLKIILLHTIPNVSLISGYEDICAETRHDVLEIVGVVYKFLALRDTDLSWWPSAPEQVIFSPSPSSPLPHLTSSRFGRFLSCLAAQTKWLRICCLALSCFLDG